MTPHPEAVAAAAEALRLIPGTTVAYPQSVAATVVAAAAPHIERAIREQVAADIEAECLRRVHSWDDFGQRRICWTCGNAARTARGQS